MSALFHLLRPIRCSLSTLFEPTCLGPNLGEGRALLAQMPIKQLAYRNQKPVWDMRGDRSSQLRSPRRNENTVRDMRSHPLCNLRSLKRSGDGSQPGRMAPIGQLRSCSGRAIHEGDEASVVISEAAKIE